MKVYKRILAGTIVAGLLLSGISDYAGNLSLISPVSASEISSSEYAFLNKNDAPITDESSVTTRLSEQAESLYKEESSVEADFSANEGTSTQPDTSVNEGSSAQSDFSTNEQSSVQEDISVQSESSEQNELTVQEELSGQGAQSAKENEQIVPGHDNSSSVSLPEDTSTAEDAKAALAEEGILLEEILPTGEAEILVGADGLPDGVTSLKETLDTSSIMNINLFDYEAYDGGRLVRAAYTDNRGNYHEAEYSWNSAGIDHSENFDTSNGKETINVDSDGKRRQFRFFPSGTGVGNGTYTINNYSGGHDTLDSAAVQGIVDDNTQNGYPVLKDGYTDNTTTKVNTDMSLAYLFDPVVSDSSVPGRTSYTGLNYLFYID